MKTKLTFGKYKGQNIDDVIQHNPLYIIWCLDNVLGFELSEIQHEKLTGRLLSKNKPAPLPAPPAEVTKISSFLSKIKFPNGKVVECFHQDVSRIVHNSGSCYTYEN